MLSHELLANELRQLALVSPVPALQPPHDDEPQQTPVRPHPRDGYGFRPPSGVSTPLTTAAGSPLPDPNGLGWPGTPCFPSPPPPSAQSPQPSPPSLVSMPPRSSVPPVKSAWPLPYAPSSNALAKIQTGKAFSERQTGTHKPSCG